LKYVATRLSGNFAIYAYYPKISVKKHIKTGTKCAATRSFAVDRLSKSQSYSKEFKIKKVYLGK